MKKQSVNDFIQNEIIHHQIGLNRLTNGMVAKVVSLLNQTDSHLFHEIGKAVEAGKTASAIARLDAMLASVRGLNELVYQKVAQNMDAGMRDVAGYEIDFQLGLLKNAPPVDLPVQAVTLDQVYAAAAARPFQGRLLNEWAKGLEVDRMVRIRDAIRMGYVTNQPTSEMVAKIRGTRAKGYADGIIQIDRRSAEAVVRTAVGHTAGVARDAVYKANGDLIKSVQWVATLDSRTSPICRQRDGLQYTCADHKPVGHAIPWLGGPGAAHWNCRSTSTPVLKSLKDLGLDLPDLPASSRSSMDGQVPEGVTYPDWFKRQSATRQDQVLGATRGALYRKGGLELGAFVNDRGQQLTLAQLRERDAGAFKKAGL